MPSSTETDELKLLGSTRKASFEDISKDENRTHLKTHSYENKEKDYSAYEKCIESRRGSTEHVP